MIHSVVCHLFFVNSCWLNPQQIFHILPFPSFGPTTKIIMMIDTEPYLVLHSDNAFLSGTINFLCYALLSPVNIFSDKFFSYLINPSICVILTTITVILFFIVLYPYWVSWQF